MLVPVYQDDFSRDRPVYSHHGPVLVEQVPQRRDVAVPVETTCEYFKSTKNFSTIIFSEEI